MGITVKELKEELSKYPKDYKVRVLHGSGLPILYISHENILLDLDEGCTLVTSEEIQDNFHERLRINTVEELLWHLQFFNDDLIVGHYDIEYASSYIQIVCDDVVDYYGKLVKDTVFLINLVHIKRQEL